MRDDKSNRGFGWILLFGIRQVGWPEELPKDEQFLEAERQQEAVHLLQGHRDSFLYFMRRRGFLHRDTWGVWCEK